MAQQTIQVTGRVTALDLSVLPVAADAGLTDKWTNTGFELVYITNGGGSPINVTETFPGTALLDGVAPASRVISVTNGKSVILGPYPPTTYNDATGNCTLTWSAVASVKIMVFRPGA